MVRRGGAAENKDDDEEGLEADEDELAVEDAEGVSLPPPARTAPLTLASISACGRRVHSTYACAR